MSLTCILEKTRKVIAFMQHSKWGVMLGKCFSKANKINCWLIVDLCMRVLTVAVKVGKSAFGFTIETGEYKWEYNYFHLLSSCLDGLKNLQDFILNFSIKNG